MNPNEKLTNQQKSDKDLNNKKKDILTDMEGSGWLKRKNRIISKEDVSPNKFATFALKGFCSWAHAILQFGFHSCYIHKEL